MVVPPQVSAEELKRRPIETAVRDSRLNHRLLFFYGLRYRTWDSDWTVSFSSIGFQGSRVAGMVNLGSKNRDFFGSFDTDLNGVAVDPGDFDMDQITDDDSLVHFPR
jgi:hypothetical protein